MKIEVGQKVYLDKTGSAYPDGIQEVEVGKVGTKFFYIKGLRLERVKFSKETLTAANEFYWRQYRVYLSREEILEKREYQKLWNALHGFVNSHYLGRKGFGGEPILATSLDHLREVCEILKIKP